MAFQPPVPNNPASPSTGSLFGWAVQISSYLRNLDQALENRVIQLVHKQAHAKATQDGLMMWDAELETIVVSKNGAWVKVGDLP